MFLGFVKLGDNLLISQLTKNGDVPTNADANPAYRIYGLVAGSVVLMTSGTGTITQTDSQTGFYTGLKSIIGGDGYVAGQTYAIKINFNISSAAKGDLHHFTVF